MLLFVQMDRKHLDMFISDDRLVLTSSFSKPQNYKLDVSFPVEIDSTSPEVSAVFDKNRKVGFFSQREKDLNF